MRYPSGKSIGFSILIWGVILMLIGFLASSIIISIQYKQIIIIGTLTVISLLLWIWFGTYYEFRDKYLLARMGPFFERIPYERITSAKKFKSMASSMALSSDMIELRHGRNYITGTTYISPIDKEEFLSELKTRCSGINTEAESNQI